MARRVVVTGVGLVSPLGIGTEETWQGLIAGRSGAGPITRFDTTDFSVKIACEVKGFDPARYFEPKEIKKFDTFIHYAVAASDMALAQSGLPINGSNADRVGVVIGSGIGGFPMIEHNHQALLERGPRRVSPFFIPGAIINMCSGLISIRTGAKGPNVATVTACSTSAHAIGDATLYIRHGYADAIIAGGAEAVISPMPVAGFSSMRALSTRNHEPEKASRPWDRDRDGFVIGEGAGIVVLEEYEQARRRGAPILAEVLGFGMSGDAFHISAPSEDGDGAIRVMRAALQDAGLRPDQVGYVNAHGTSTPAGDPIEVIAVKAVFGDHARRVMVSSTKSMTGHLLGAAGGVEFGVSVLVVARGVVPPTINLDRPEPDDDLDHVPHHAREVPVKVALSNSFGFGGTNACLVVGAVD
ncbi:MAG TPA: beta-ketoacyl-ACP synthase II [Thermoanaerobaculales bacterium]|nr:beta-ketoacyl-ACP synthase II [Thermoanaerobaculales bacterium]HPA80494.1 beta-ketoacyl-ACP synthase II [Thermoanaerobaculales bacterium]HQL29779.1 beta-ketoacyl-ACP synthase II [Thermoanaerobaculales bacterium]HQN97099.1 beta-ketoacyl-ACP synthase II [Thermoanaerobaculales bacterium]